MPQATHDRDDSIGARPIGDPPRKRGIAGWLIPLALLALAVIVLALLLSRCGGSDSDSSAPAATASTATLPSPSTAASTTPTSAAPSAGGTSSGDGGSSGGMVTADGKTMIPLTDASGGDLSAYAGQEATSQSVQVQSVPADEGFWVGPGADDRVWVQLTGSAGESPFMVKTGDSVAFTGKVVKNAAGFAASVGVTDSEGASMLDSQGYHIAVARSALKLAT